MPVVWQIELLTEGMVFMCATGGCEGWSIVLVVLAELHS